MSTRLIILCLVAHLGILSSYAREPSDIVLGVSAAFSGPSKALGIELFRGSKAYFDEINRTGGVRGHKITLKLLDDGYNPKPAVNNTIELIHDNEIFSLYNYVGTPTVTRVLPLLKKYEANTVFLLFPFTGANPHRSAPYNHYVFNLRASYGQETKALVDHFVNIGRKRIALFYQADAYGRSGWDGVRKALSQYNLPIVAETTYRRGSKFDNDFSTQANIIAEHNANAIISVGSYAACAGFIRDARLHGITAPIANVSFVGSEKLLNLLLQEGKTLKKDLTQNLINSQVVPNYHNTKLPAVREYRRLMQAVTDQQLDKFSNKDYQPLAQSYISFEGFLNAKVFVEMLRRMPGELTREKIKMTFEKMAEVDIGIDEKITFSPRQHQGLHRVYFSTVKDNKFVTLKNWSAWAL